MTQASARKGSKPSVIKLLCISKGDAGRILGVDAGTISRYVKRGSLQAIPWKNGDLIPLYEVAMRGDMTLSKAEAMVKTARIMTHFVWMEFVRKERLDTVKRGKSGG